MGYIHQSTATRQERKSTLERAGSQGDGSLPNFRDITLERSAMIWNGTLKVVVIIIVGVIALTFGICEALQKADGSTPSKTGDSRSEDSSGAARLGISSADVHQSVKNDVSQRLSLHGGVKREIEESTQGEPRDVGLTRSSPTVRAAGAAVEQKSKGTPPSALRVESFCGLGFGFEGRQGKANVRNPSANHLSARP